jgi:SAM-dependent methyltransferase
MTSSVPESNAHEHWQRVWTDKEPTEVSWFEPSPRVSLELIDQLELAPDAAIIDVGGGASGLTAELVRRGHQDLTVADVSEAALARAREGMGADAARVDWVVADVREADFGREFALWHDRAVFHFLTAEADRHAYRDVLQRSLAVGGLAIIATFAPEGPTSCSGLPVARYAADELAAELTPVLELRSSQTEVHETPTGNEQQFLYALFAAV